MNTANLKTYAPKARNDFIEAVTRQAAKYGFKATRTEALTIKGDIALIGDRAFPRGL